MVQCAVITPGLILFIQAASLADESLKVLLQGLTTRIGASREYKQLLPEWLRKQLGEMNEASHHHKEGVREASRALQLLRREEAREAGELAAMAATEAASLAAEATVKMAHVAAQVAAAAASVTETAEPPAPPVEPPTPEVVLACRSVEIGAAESAMRCTPSSTPRTPQEQQGSTPSAGPRPLPGRTGRFRTPPSPPPSPAAGEKDRPALELCLNLPTDRGVATSSRFISDRSFNFSLPPAPEKSTSTDELMVAKLEKRRAALKAMVHCGFRHVFAVAVASPYGVEPNATTKHPRART